MELLLLAGMFLILNFVLLLMICYNAGRIRAMEDEVGKR